MKDYQNFTVEADQYDGWFSIECKVCKEYVTRPDKYIEKSYTMYPMSVAEILELIEKHDCNS